MTESQESVEAFIERMLDEALAGYERITGPEELEAIRSCLKDELMFHPAGKERVRRAMSDAKVERSGKVVKRGDVPGAAVTPLRKKGHGS
ncbi:MAG: hypothetical protein ABIO72_02505 [Patescibacteria group bacterium]